MKTRLIAALLVAVSAAVAAPAFASGYGPAPFYRPSVGAPASQRGVSAQTFAAERNQATAANEAVGGVTGASSESGSRQPAQAANDVNVFKGH
ncbi:hypothetical protein [Paraburkholderia hospita]|jgi:hypothetical protein|uniref:DUF4148 domain-containing protein n=1 Tax=Paraburkholderia hospita TaxID=169430 RepID=A0AAJ4SWY2_9BURK|nr:hypothetical protein [Paraburkholderia hospita]EUC19295.1 hypothetical protein PMI06_002596 [Burkholderia sp. BT03]SKC91560.1 hypothetical protein SAMN05445504_6269 [Burkholderia sp. CF099]AUT71751.1 hypothetical protein C2L64_26275 [Paraburkholderia hospita]AXF02700.1 hypothetical protein CUJ88_30975 [Paraburkholderia hospita]EIM96110.1 hypothetical protein WQE_35930 [Paraburkholderia hospita]